jgi:hypothetical protein
VRINVQLIDSATDEHLWADTYDRRLTAVNIFAIQTEIATAIADALRATLSPEEQERLASVPTENLAAYESYLLGRQRLLRDTTAALVEAVDYFQQAIELDPGFALAYVGLADSYVMQVYFVALARRTRHWRWMISWGKPTTRSRQSKKKGRTSRVLRQCTDVPWS